jgi:D-3-phosphoglycerate dehydrogenase / 2-oxoglutarate reductase
VKVSILDDYFDTLRTLQCFARLDGYEVAVWNDHIQDVDALAARLQDTEILVLIRERTQIREPLLKRLDALRLISFSSGRRTCSSTRNRPSILAAFACA